MKNEIDSNHQESLTNCLLLMIQVYLGIHPLAQCHVVEITCILKLSVTKQHNKFCLVSKEVKGS